jgi:hypothetical protein
VNLNLTPLQIIGIILAINGALTGATAQLTDLFGAMVAKDVVSVASLGSAILGGIITAMSGQASQVKNVLAMPGIERITVNAQANQTLSAIAIDPASDKIGPTQAAQADVTKKANVA